MVGRRLWRSASDRGPSADADKRTDSCWIALFWACAAQRELFLQTVLQRQTMEMGVGLPELQSPEDPQVLRGRVQIRRGLALPPDVVERDPTEALRALRRCDDNRACADGRGLKVRETEECAEVVVGRNAGVQRSR